MKTSLLIFSLFFICDIFGQGIPNDSVLLKTIFGHVDFNKKTATIERPDDYKDDIWGDSIKFEVVFKEYVLVEGQELLLVASEAFCFQHTGHYWGFRNKYFFRKNKLGLEIVKKWRMMNQLLLEIIQEWKS
jgi:hypothetical protein